MRRLWATALVGGVGALLLAGLPAAARAQAAAPRSAACAEKDQAAQGCAPADGDATTSPDEIVVTGSRLREPASYSSPDPVQVITGEQSALQGFANTAQIVQQSTVAANGRQINNFFTGQVVGGGPGVNTVSLRGLGADRTLVLLDGQRIGPAGVSGTVGSVDLNTIPSTLIDHIDILKDGSSSIYGSDAVAGVVNIVTRRNLQGLELHLYAKPSEGGEEYDLAGSWGMKFDRGYVSVSADYYQQQALLTGDRSYLDCPQDFAYGAGGQRLDLVDPRDPGHYKCYGMLVNAIQDANTGFRYIPASLAAPGAPTGGDPPGLHRVACTVRDLPGGAACSANAAYPIDVALTRLSQAQLPYHNPMLDEVDAISPVQRWTVVASGAYDLIPGRVQVYDDFMFNRRVSSQTGARQVFAYLFPGNPSNAFNSSSGHIEIPIVSALTPAHQSVDYFRDLFGFRGDLPDLGTVTGIHYDLSAQFSHSSGSYADQVFLADRVNASVAPGGCNPAFAEAGPSMRSLGDTAACVPVDWTAAAFNGGFAPQELGFLTAWDAGHTLYTQEYAQGDIQADLFKLPAGPLAADVGFMLRRDYIDDVPGPAARANNLWASTSAGITTGSDKVREVFGELDIPVLRDLPLAHSLDVRVSGRYSNYDSVGDAKTYKAEGRWALTSWLALKYVQGTSFRAPQLYELYLADQTSFLPQIGLDPCIDYGQSANPNLAKTCAAAGIGPSYAGGGAGATVLTGGGLGNLKPETSLSHTASVVLTPHLFGVDAGLEVDYYQNHIRNGIQQFGAANIVDACYNSSAYPNNGFCSLLTRDPATHGITLIHDNFVNVADLIDRGIDASIYWNQRLPEDIQLRLDSQLSWTLKQTTQLLNSSSVIDYNGTVGSPEFVGNVNITLTRGVWAVNWFMNMVGATSDARLTNTSTSNYRGTGVAASYLLSTPFYTVQNLSVRRSFPHGLSIEVGVMNLLNSVPPAYSYDGVQSLIGQVPLTSQYDLVGRTAFFTVDKRF